MAEITAEQVKRVLGLVPHPREGGWFVRTVESAEMLTAETFANGRYGGPRRLVTAIYYLLEPGTFSEMHRLRSDEVFHLYLGGPVEMLQLHDDGHSEHLLIGTDLMAGERPQVLVPRGVWQGARLLEDQGFALLGCTVSPGFEFEDYESARSADLVARWPNEASRIRALTHF